MQKKPKIHIPPYLLLLDLVGALAAALGLVETFDPGTLLSPRFTFPFYNGWLIILGLLLMLPLVLHMVATARRQNEAADRQTSVIRSKR